MAEMPERSAGTGGGAADVDGHERQTESARTRNQSPRSDVVTASPVMEEVLEGKSVLDALRRVKKNAGGPGVDGMTVEDLVAVVSSSRWQNISNELLGDRYRPSPVRGCEIPKPQGGTRTLGIPTVIDRLIQQSMLQQLQPRIDRTFSESSFGFRPGRSAHQAIERWKHDVEAGHEWVVDIDLKSFFDRVQHDVLMARVSRHVKDKRLLRLIGRYLRAGLMMGGLVSQRTEGTPQGGPVSPLLSNILLDDLDRELERRGHRFIRYADDFIILVKSRAAAERVFVSVVRFLKDRLKLDVNQEKSRVARVDEITFLGYSMTFTRNGDPKLTIPNKSRKRIRTKLRETLGRPARGDSMKQAIVRLNPVLRGLFQYYRLVGYATELGAIDGWVRRRLRWLAWRHWKTPRTRRKRLIALGVPPGRARKAAYSRCGPWRCSASPTIHEAIPNEKLERLSLYSMARAHARELLRPTQLRLTFL